MAAQKLVFTVYDNPLKKDYLLGLPEGNQKMYMAETAEELADQLTEICSNPLLYAEMVEKASTWAALNTWENVADVYEKLWKL